MYYLCAIFLKQCLKCHWLNSYHITITKLWKPCRRPMKKRVGSPTCRVLSALSFYSAESWGLDPCLRLRTYPSALMDGSQNVQHLPGLSPLLAFGIETVIIEQIP